MPVTPKSKQLRTLDAQIAERQRYYRQQEKLIEEMVEAGNTQLMALNHDILLAQSELRQLKVEIRNRRQDMAILDDELEVRQASISVVAISVNTMPILRPI